MFSTVLADAPRLLAFLLPRDMVALCHSDTGAVRNAVLCHRPAIALLLGERVLAFDTRKISLREAVLSSLLLLQDVPRDVPSAEAKATAKACDARPALHLDQLHRLLPPEPAGWKRRGTIGQERWQRAVVAERWKQRGAQRSPEMMKCYRAFVRDVVGPLVKMHSAFDEFIVKTNRNCRRRSCVYVADECVWSDVFVRQSSVAEP